MSTITRIGDRLAVGAALLCAIHCFLTPVFIAMLPSLQALSILDDEKFHFWMMIGVLPTSLIALAMGCKKHKRFTFLGIGLLGLVVLVFAALWGHDLLGCKYERYLTLTGSLIISIAHINNYRLCRSSNSGAIEPSCEAC